LERGNRGNPGPGALDLERQLEVDERVHHLIQEVAAGYQPRWVQLHQYSGIG